MLWHARWDRRLPPLAKKKTWPSMSSIPPKKNLLQKFLAILIRKLPLPTVGLCLKALDFLHFQIISNYTIKGWNNLTCYNDEITFVENFISASITLVDIHLNLLNWCHFLILTGNPILVLRDCMIFLSPYLDATKMTMSTVFSCYIWTLQFCTYRMFFFNLGSKLP